MEDLKSLGLIVRSTNEGLKEGSERLEVRMASNGNFVAAFCTVDTKTSDGAKEGISTDLVVRDELTPAQYDAVKKWLHRQVVLYFL